MPRGRAALLALCGVLYFSEGLPFGLVNELGPLYLRQRGASLTQIGLLSTISLAWTLKFLWSPLIDRVGSYRSWIRGALCCIVASLLPLAFSTAPPLTVVWVSLTLLAIASASQDIAVDALTIVTVPPRDFGYVNSTRIATYRGAIIFTGGGLAAVASYLGWSTAFGVAVAVCAVLLVFAFFLPATNRGDPSSNVVDSLSRWLRHPQLGPILIVALLYRMGDAALAPMIKPFWLDSGFSVAEIGTVTTVIAVSFTILGSIVGGMVIARYGILRSLLWLGIAQMASNIGYALIAQTGAPHAGWYAVAITENFTGGLGAAAFLSFLMSTADREHAATDFALLSALYRLGASAIGTASGKLAEVLGYTIYFWLTVALGVPALILIYLLRERVAAAAHTSEAEAT